MFGRYIETRLRAYRLQRPTKGKPTALKFDVSTGNAPLIVGLDVKSFCDNININNRNILLMLRSEDKTEKLFFNTYIRTDDFGNERIQIKILPRLKTNAYYKHVGKNTVGKKTFWQQRYMRKTSI